MDGALINTGMSRLSLLLAAVVLQNSVSLGSDGLGFSEFGSENLCIEG